ncbi:MAG: MFS transporter [Candidatus Thorarchaeota archaeon]|nr:MFS transporter [Candidatus Thorarchaeota archaeon]
MTEERKLGYLDKVRLFKKDARLWIAINAMNSFAFGVSNVVFNLYMVSLPSFEEDFLGFFLSVSMFATALVAVPAGMLTDRRSRKSIIMIASLISLLMVFIQYTMIEPTPLIFSQILLGLANGFTQVAWGPYVTDLSTSEERAHLFGFSSGISLLTVLAGNLLGGYLPGFFLGFLGSSTTQVWAYRYTLWFSLVPLAIAFITLLSMSKDSVLEFKLEISFKNVSNWGFIGKYTSSVSAIGLGAGMIVLFFNLFFKNEFQAGDDLIGVIFGINTIILALGNFSAPALADRFGKVRTIMFTEALSIPFLLMISWAPTIYLAVAAYVARNVLMNMAGPVSSAFFMEGLRKEERATATGVVRSGDSFVRGVAANIGGALLAAGFYRLPYLLVAGLYVLGIALFYSFFKNKEKELELLRLAEVKKERPPEGAPDIT